MCTMVWSVILCSCLFVLNLGGKGGGLIEIIGTSDPYSLDLNGDPTTNDNTPSRLLLAILMCVCD